MGELSEYGNRKYYYTFIPVKILRGDFQQRFRKCLRWVVLKLFLISRQYGVVFRGQRQKGQTLMESITTLFYYDPL